MIRRDPLSLRPLHKHRLSAAEFSVERQEHRNTQREPQPPDTTLHSRVTDGQLKRGIVDPLKDIQ